MMSLLQMSASAAILTLAVIVIRAFTVNRLPKKTFLALWGVVLLRLLVPVSIPSPFSVYTLVNRATARADAGFATPVPPVVVPAGTQVAGFPGAQAAAGRVEVPWLLLLWAVGFAACALFFAVGYWRSRRKFATATPVSNAVVSAWQAAHAIGRRVAVRQSDEIAAPLTYGVLRPVILLPRQLDWQDEDKLRYILAHEYVHIRRFDAVVKLVMIAALCIHWFNPMVWLMFLLANRDIELSCDEAVVRAFGETTRAAYARVLIGMEEQKGGLMPLCNSFSKNAIEERITAIMKTRKRTLLAMLAAVVLVLFVTVSFATSASPTALGLDDEPIGGGRQQVLEAFRFAGYQDMTVAAYQEKAWALLDTGDYRAAVEELAQSQSFYDLRESENSDAAFLFYTLEPLTAENWQMREFGGYVQMPADGTAGNPAMLEYALYITLLDAERLTVGDYGKARRGVMDGLRAFMEQKTTAQLMDETAMQAALTSEIASLRARWESTALQLKIEYNYVPLTALDEDTMADISSAWETGLAPYAPFGVTYELDEMSGQAKLYWNGKQVGSIFNEREGIWLANSAGDAVHDAEIELLLAVYTGDTLTGVREATAQERERWSESDASGAITEPRQYPPATKEDYQSLLALKTANYQRQSVAAFNAALLDWGNLDFERTQRIQEDAGTGGYQVALTEEERAFVEQTVLLSNKENAQMIKSLQLGVPEEDPWRGGVQLNKQADSGGRSAWCTLWYQFPYHISDKDKLTVGERDRCIAGFSADLQAFWDQTSLEELLQMTEGDVIAAMRAAASRNSNDLLTIFIDSDQVLFEYMDERERVESVVSPA